MPRRAVSDTEPLIIKVKYFDERLPKLKFIGGKDHSNWVDLVAGKSMELLPGEDYDIPLGVAMELPEGYEGIVAPRSSSYKRYGITITNSFGIIDHSYCGNNDEWHLLVHATRGAFIKRGDRIAQFRIQQIQPDLRFEEVTNLDNADRGGIGSTGK